MRHPVVHQYRSPDELVRLKDGLFSEDAGVQRRAISRVHALKSRGKLPHGIEATAMLVEIALEETKSEVNEVQLQLLYLMALIRFVNGLLDPLQSGASAQPLYHLAQSLELPGFFVEMRHMATHDGVPSIDMCRYGCREALEWLRNHYWCDIVATGDQGDDDDDEHTVMIVNLVKNYKKLYKTDPDNVRGKSLTRVADLFRLVAPAELVETMIERGLLVSKKRRALVSCFAPLVGELGIAFKLELFKGLVASEAEEATVDWLLAVIETVLEHPKRELTSPRTRIFDEMWESLVAAQAQVNSSNIPVLERFLALYEALPGLMDKHLAKDGSPETRAKITEKITKLKKVIKVRKQFGVPNVVREVTPPVKRAKVNRVYLFEKAENWSTTPFGIAK